MKRSCLSIALGIVAVAVLTAQTPVPSRPPGKPIRHLEYSFTVEQQSAPGHPHWPGIGGGPHEIPGTDDAAAIDAGKGTMRVDVMSVRPDGGLLVGISEVAQGEAFPRAASTCTVYGNTTVLCSSIAALSRAELVLLRYLGRQFVDGAPWDSANHWQRKTNTPQYDIVEDFTLTGARESSVVVVNETRSWNVHNGGFGSRNEQVSITYDRAMEIPAAVHDDEIEIEDSSVSSRTSYDFRLTADSFSKTASR